MAPNSTPETSVDASETHIATSSNRPPLEYHHANNPVMTDIAFSNSMVPSKHTFAMALPPMDAQSPSQLNIHAPPFCPGAPMDPSSTVHTMASSQEVFFPPIGQPMLPMGMPMPPPLNGTPIEHVGILGGIHYHGIHHYHGIPMEDLKLLLQSTRQQAKKEAIAEYEYKRQQQQQQEKEATGAMKKDSQMTALLLESVQSIIQQQQQNQSRQEEMWTQVLESSPEDLDCRTSTTHLREQLQEIQQSLIVTREENTSIMTRVANIFGSLLDIVQEMQVQQKEDSETLLDVREKCLQLFRDQQDRNGIVATPRTNEDISTIVSRSTNNSYVASPEISPSCKGNPVSPSPASTPSPAKKNGKKRGGRNYWYKKHNRNVSKGGENQSPH